MVAAAIIGGAVVGAAGTAIAGSEAAGATKDASNAAIQQQQSALAQQSALSAPYRQLGESAIPTLQSLLGIGPSAPGGIQSAAGGANPGAGQGVSGGYRIGGAGQIGTAVAAPPGAAGGSPPAGAPGTGGVGNLSQSTQQTLSALSSDPMYQFAQQQGQQGAINAASAQGLSLSGNTLEGLSRFNQGLASETYQSYLGDLQSVVGLGQAAAAGQASNIGTAASNIGNTLVNQGNTLAGIDVNTAAGLTKAIGNASNQYTQYQTLQGLQSPDQEMYSGSFGANPSGAQAAIDPATGADYSAWSDRRLKTDVEQVGVLESGLPVYRFRYLFDNEVRFGVMADEAEKMFPAAVMTRHGFKRVDYRKIH